MGQLYIHHRGANLAKGVHSEAFTNKPDKAKFCEKSITALPLMVPKASQKTSSHYD